MDLNWDRQADLTDLHALSDTDKSDFLYVRGRRRVGKSWLLETFQKQYPNCFYYTGKIDAGEQHLLQDIARHWDQFTKRTQLADLRPYALHWPALFDSMTTYATGSTQPLFLIFDEVQWIAKAKSGFIGSLKVAWQAWEKTGRIKVIICGSSNKFFHDHVGGEEKTLRGLKTRSDIWVKPFTLSTVKKYYFPQWSLAEVALIYMMLGGIPYYLNQIAVAQGFIHAVNQAMFMQKTIFLEELDEILNLEFYANARETVKQILAVLGQDGCEQHNIVKKTGLSESGVSELLQKLVDYQLVFRKLPLHGKPKKNAAGYRYYMKDFFINFYFQVLAQHQAFIRGNRDQLYFPYQVLTSKKGCYINNFSGKAFELLLRVLLEDKYQRHAKLFAKLALGDANYDVGTYWDEHSQIDLVVEHHADRFTRLIECKWLAEPLTRNDTVLLQQLSGKSCPTLDKNQLRRYLLASAGYSPEFKKQAKKLDVALLDFKDLF